MAISKLVNFTLVLAVAIPSWSQVSSTVPTQTDIVKRGAKAYFPRLGSNLVDNIMSISGLGDFKFYEKIQSENPEKSPFRVFNANNFKRKPQKEWSFAFYNTGFDLKDVVKNEFGFCAGFSTALRKFNMLTYFDPTNTEGQNVPSRESNPTAWFNFYKTKIDAVMANQMVVIPNFDHLYELSSDPEIGLYMKQMVVRQWELTNVNLLQGIGDGFLAVTKKMNSQDLNKTYDYLKKRLSYGYNPIVYLAKHDDDLTNSKTAKKVDAKWYNLKQQLEKLRITINEMSKQWIHVLMITELSDRASDGSFTFKVWDINEKASEGAMKKVTVDGTGNISLNYDYTINSDNSITVFNRTLSQNDPMFAQFTDVVGKLKSNAMEIHSIVPLMWDDLEIEHMIKSNLNFCYEHGGLEGRFCTQKN